MPRRKRVCPLVTDIEGFGIECDKRCAWNIDGECAIAVIAKAMKRREESHEQMCKKKEVLNLTSKIYDVVAKRENQ